MVTKLVTLIFVIFCLRQCLAMTRCPAGWILNNSTSSSTTSTPSTNTTTTNTTTTTTTTTTSSSCYYVSEEEEWNDFSDSQQMCKSVHQKSDLVSANNLDELLFIYNITSDKNYRYWLGGFFNQSHSSWKWVDGDSVSSELDNQWTDGSPPAAGWRTECLFVTRVTYMPYPFWEALRCSWYYSVATVCELSGEECEVGQSRTSEPDCIDVDCLWSSWSFWSVCQCSGSNLGTKERTRSLHKEQTPGVECGQRTKIEDCTAECNQVCRWSSWDDCSCDGLFGSRTRRLRQLYGSARCSYNEDKEECNSNCVQAMLGSVADGAMVAWLFGVMMQAVMYFMGFMFLCGMSLFIFAFVVVYHIMKYEILPRRYQQSKPHVI